MGRIKGLLVLVLLALAISLSEGRNALRECWDSELRAKYGSYQACLQHLYTEAEEEGDDTEVEGVRKELLFSHLR